MSTNCTLVPAQKVLAEMPNALLLDVRTPAEFEDAHIAGSVLHSLSNLDSKTVQELASNKSHCVLVCGSGKRASQAGSQLEAAGLQSVLVLEGGIKAWEAQGLPLERGKKTISLERQVRIAAGSLVLLGVVLAWVHAAAWIVLPAFVGAGLIFAGITDTCGMAMLLARMPWNTRIPKSTKSCCSL